MSVRVGLVYLESLKVEISSQIQQWSLPCQCKVLNVGETALKPALEVVENSKIKRSKGTTHCWFVVQCSVFCCTNIMFNVKDGRRCSALMKLLP